MVEIHKIQYIRVALKIQNDEFIIALKINSLLSMSMQNQLKMYFYTPVCIIVLILQLFDFTIWCFNLEVSLLYTQYTCKDLMIKQFLNKETF